MRLVRFAAALLLTTVAASAAAAPAGGPGYHVIDRIPGPDGGWDYASYDAKHGRVLVARTTGVDAFDPRSRKVTAAFAPAAWGHAAFAVNGGSELLITNGAKALATFVDAETGAPVASVATGLGPDDAIFDPKTGLLLVMDHVGGDITLIDPRTHKAVGTIAVGGTLEASAVDGKGRAFVNIENRNQIAVVDLAARKVVARYDLAGCEGPTGLAYAAADRLLIAACDGVAEIVRADTGKVVRSIRIGDGADGVAYDAARGLAFVPAGRDGTLSVIRVAHGDATLIDTVPTQKGARTLTLDPVTGRVFLPTAQYLPAVGGGRPTVKPGTFELLVVGK
jgi:DNA-binding beta-propeller fold protein YncE